MIAKEGSILSIDCYDPVIGSLGSHNCALDAAQEDCASLAHTAGIEVRVPAGMSPRAEKKAVDSLVAKLQRRRAPRSDAQLLTRALELNQRYLDSQARIGSVRWVDNQHTRWGYCTTSTGDIRLSSRLQGAPEYVVDAVLIHELVHTFVPSHSREFWQWADRAPKAECAKGYLEALSQLG